MKMDVKFSSEVVELLGKRGLKEADVVEVIQSAESSGIKLTQGDKNLAKKRIGEVTIYALYDDSGNVETAYSHRMQLGEMLKTTDQPDLSKWICNRCKEPAQQGTTNMTYLTVTRAGPAIVSPKCGDSWVEEYLAIKTLAAAEGLFEKKRA
ncbi:MAG: hypothetical protein ABR986_02310 [Methanomassiliicoccales archaeon]|jgi:hypothetical protein